MGKIKLNSTCKFLCIVMRLLTSSIAFKEDLLIPLAKYVTLALAQTVLDEREIRGKSYCIIKMN